MNFTFTKYLLTTAAVLCSTVYSSNTINQTPLGGGALDSNSQSSLVNASSAYSNVNEAESNTEKSQKYIKVDEDTKAWIKNVEKTRSKVNALSQEEVIKELVNLLNNQNNGTENKTFDTANNITYFADSNIALYSKYLLKSAINYQKTNNIQATADHAKFFTGAMSLLSDEDKSKLSLLIFQIITNCEEQGQDINPKDEIPVSFDTLNIDELFSKSAKNHPLAKAILSQHISNEFLLAFIYKYFKTAQVSPALAQEQLNVILDKKETPVTDIQELLGQLHKQNLNWENYNKEVLSNKINTISDISEEQKRVLSYKYSIDGISNNAQPAIEEFNTARDRAIKYKLTEALNHIILIITEMLKHKLENK